MLKAQGTEFYGQNVSLPTRFDDLREQKNKYMPDSATQTKEHSPDFRVKKLY